MRMRTLGTIDILVYRAADGLTEPLLYAMILFSPWAFGTTQPWSIWTMNFAGYALGLLLLPKLAIRWFKGYEPSRWGQQATAPRNLKAGGKPASARRHAGNKPIFVLAGLTVAILGYCLVSAVNARATYNPRELGFDYHSCISWLPHSFDSTRTWAAFWNYLALACAFWAAHDWLLGKSDTEARTGHGSSSSSKPPVGWLFPARLRRLLWVLCVNGGVLGAECIAQRLSGTGKLLWLVMPHIHKTALTQLGPYAYRSNGAQYLNLLWPVCLGFWWTLNRSRQRSSARESTETVQADREPTPVPMSSRHRGRHRSRRRHSHHSFKWNFWRLGFRQHAGPGLSNPAVALGGGHHVLLACAALMAAACIISTSRGAAFVAVAILVAAGVFLSVTEFLFAEHRMGDHRLHEGRVAGGGEVPSESALNVQHLSGAPAVTLTKRITTAPANGGGKRMTPVFVLVFVATSLALGLEFGWGSLQPRLGSSEIEQGMAGREATYAQARPMAADFPWYGTGPNTFATVFQLYLPPGQPYWIQLHDDWLETRITFGWVGSALIGAALLTVLWRWFRPGGIHGGRRFVILAWLALGGCMLHARFDFPFQVYSILFLFLVLCSVLSVLTRWPG